jgi:hypothetical protein
MSDADYVECWFIGGPWNNRLERLHRRFLEHGAVFRVPKPDATVFWEALNVLHVLPETADYYRQEPLETGAQVFSCLKGARCRAFYTRFALTSVKRT